MSKVKHFSFKQEYQSICSQLLSDVHIYTVTDTQGTGGLSVKALWDTGATGSAITPALAKTMKLVPIDRVKVAGVNDTRIVDVVNVSIGLPNMVMVREVKVMVCNLNQTFDMVIGMDIIMLGDFSISNGNGMTSFSFAIPPFEIKTDLYEKALAINKRNRL